MLRICIIVGGLLVIVVGSVVIVVGLLVVVVGLLQRRQADKTRRMRGPGTEDDDRAAAPGGGKGRRVVAERSAGDSAGFHYRGRIITCDEPIIVIITL